MTSVTSVDVEWFRVAKEEATDFVETNHRLQQRVQSATSHAELQTVHRRLEEMAADAREHCRRYEELADIWRGSELNLSMFMRSNAVHAARERIEAAVRTPTTIQELIAQVENEAQKQALQRLLYSPHNLNYQIYLSAYAPNPVTTGRGSHTDVQGTFTMLGTVRNGTRESYTVKWYRPGASHSFWCSCPDHKFNSAKKDMVCKHICFLVTRVGRILDPAFFVSKRFTPDQHQQFEAAVGNAAIFADGARERERLATAAAAATRVMLPTTYAPVVTVDREARRAP